MKFFREITTKGLNIPIAAIKLAKLKVGDKVDLFASEDALVLLKRKMTAMELINTSLYLHHVAAELLAHLVGTCGLCCDCDESCPVEDYDEEGISLPDYLREEAGIPEKAKLCACVDEDNSTVTISAAGYDHDMTDVPPIIVDMLADAGVCLGALEEHLIRGDIVYGGE